MNIIKREHKREKRELSPLATYSINSKKEYAIQPDFLNYQTNFRYDRTMIINSDAFKRLREKAQVFINPKNDHLRTRMTHTLEVADIAINIAYALELNQNLADAIALAHDIGHTPFGHAGEKAFRESYDKKFSHEIQGRRVVEKLEKVDYLPYRGLNLTIQVRDGIQNHDFESFASTLEGQVVKFADKIAYISHDIEDAFRMGILTKKNFPEEYFKVFGKTVEERKNTLITSVIEASYGQKTIMMHNEHLKLFKELRQYMFKNVYLSDTLKEKEEHAKNVIIKLFEYYSHNPKQIPIKYVDGDDRQKACDYISGMTDQYAYDQYKKKIKEKNMKLTEF